MGAWHRHSSLLTVRSPAADAGSVAAWLWAAESFFISGSNATASSTPPQATSPSLLNRPV